MGKKKGRLPDGSGPQRDRTRPQLRGGARQLACCSMRAHEVRRPFGATRAAGTMLTAPGRGTSETLPEILRPWPLWPRPRPRQGRVTVAAGQEWSFSLHFRRPSLRGGVKSETVVELFCRKSPGGVSHLPQRPQRSSPCLIRPPSRRGLSVRPFRRP